MPDLKPYSYAVIRVVPRVERDEFINAGVILYSQQGRYLKAMVNLADERIHSLWPDADVGQIKRHLATIPRICDGDSTAGPIARLTQSERFHWLTTPRSTVIQISPVRTGLTETPELVLKHLAGELVA